MMPVIRIERNKNYTSMSTYHLRDKRLSLRAMGLLSKMLSLPPEWDYTVSGLAAICKEGRDAVRAALLELEAAGYVEREQTHTEDGTFGKNDYVVREEPRTQPLTGNPSTVSPSTAQPLTGNPSTVSPSTAQPLTGNAAQLNIDLSNNISNTPPIVPQRGKRVRSVAKHEPEMFERLWKRYPCGKDKAGAVREWDKLKPDRALMLTMSAALDRDIASDEWQRGIGIPYLCRWISKRRWEDEQRAPIAPAAQEEQEVQVWS